jgi:6-phosphofructokinase 2
MKVISLCLNPALDKSAKVEAVVPEDKLKCHTIKYQAGGGGINISRILSRLEMASQCIYPYGGNSGEQLKELLEEENFDSHPIHIESWTRENLAVVDISNNLQYRFGMPGNAISPNELAAIENCLEELLEENDILILSGSLPLNFEPNYYAQLIVKLRSKKIRIILDTAGKALPLALAEEVYMVKPNSRELAEMEGKELMTLPEQEIAALAIIAAGKAKYVVVSSGGDGAFIATKEGIVRKKSPKVDVKSTIGAGDSMVAGLIYALQNKYSTEQMLNWGMACGIATTTKEGTGLAQKETVLAMLERLENSID